MADAKGGGFTILQHWDNGDSAKDYSLGVVGRQPTGNHRFAGTLGTADGCSAAFAMAAYGSSMLAVEVGTAWQNADIGMSVSTDGTAWLPCYDNTGALVKITGIGTATAGLYFFGANSWPAGAYNYFRLRSYGVSASTAYLPTSAEVVYAVMLF